MNDKALSAIRGFFDGSQTGAGAGLGVKAKALGVGFEAEFSDLRTNRLTKNGIQSVHEEKIALQAEAGGLKVGYERINGRVSPAWSYKGISGEFGKMEYSLTVSVPPTGQAVNGKVQMNFLREK